MGAHVVRALLRAGAERVVALDDLSSGHRDTLPSTVRFVHADVRDSAVGRVLREERIAHVVHCAARIQIGESLTDPRLYWRDNLAAGIALLEHVLDAGVRHFVFSSSAAVYGRPDAVPVGEGARLAPESPYGETKVAFERALAGYAHAYSLSYVALRYFNAAGAEPGLAERHDPETHLLPLAIDAALGRGAPLVVFGDDHGTPDGTCVRDYVHVADLADAHVAAVRHLATEGGATAINLGTGSGTSVRQVLDAVALATGRPVPHRVGPRRAGDPPALVASCSRAERVLGWRATRTFDETVRAALASRDV